MRQPQFLKKEKLFPTIGLYQKMSIVESIQFSSFSFVLYEMKKK